MRSDKSSDHWRNKRQSCNRSLGSVRVSRATLAYISFMIFGASNVKDGCSARVSGQILTYSLRRKTANMWKEIAQIMIPTYVTASLLNASRTLLNLAETQTRIRHLSRVFASMHEYISPQHLQSLVDSLIHHTTQYIPRNISIMFVPQTIPCGIHATYGQATRDTCALL